MTKEQNDDYPEEISVQAECEEVGDEEMLARFVLLGDDKFVGGDNRIKTGALKMEHFREKDGWSLSRQEYVSNMKKELEKRSAKKKGNTYGYAQVKVAEVREIQDKIKKQAIRVVAAPEQDEPAHALAQQTSKFSKPEAKSIRDELLTKFSKVLTE